MKYSEDCMIRGWQVRHDEIKSILYDMEKEMDFYITNEESMLASILYEYKQKLYKRKRMIEKYLDGKGTDLY